MENLTEFIKQSILKKILIIGAVIGTIGICLGLIRQKTVTIDIDRLVAPGGNYSPTVRKAIQGNKVRKIKLNFPKGTYNFYPEGAFVKEHFITNHENGVKNIAFLFEGFEEVTLEGNGSEFIFHGSMLPFVLESSNNIKLKNFTVDWAIPSYVQGTIVAVDAANHSYDLKMFSTGFEYQVKEGVMTFPLSDGLSYNTPGPSLLFDSATRAPVKGAAKFDMHRKNKEVNFTQLPNGNVRVREVLGVSLIPGAIMTLQGPIDQIRYGPAIHALNSKNIIIDEVNVYHALGMGFLGERSTDISLRKFNVCLRPGSNRVVSTIADATHFCNCKGRVEIQDCLFENMLDDGTNVHGTYMEVREISAGNRLIATLKHPQQAGFKFGESGDETWFLISPDTERKNGNRIAAFKMLDDRNAEITFRNELPADLKPGDLIENKTWNTESFVLRDCVIRNHRARNIVLKTPGEVVIENNHLNSMMASILLRGEGNFWFESGANENVVIRNNVFDNCMYGGGRGQAIILISPRFGKQYDMQRIFDRNIQIYGNEINTSVPEVFQCAQAGKLSIYNNRVNLIESWPDSKSGTALISLAYCSNVMIRNNFFNKPLKRLLDADEKTHRTLTTDIPLR